jgi:hypothetical protein
MPASGLPTASQAECDKPTDFPVTPTDFRDIRPIFAAPGSSCVAMRHQAPAVRSS